MIGCFRYLNAYPYRRLLAYAGLPYRLFDEPKGLAQAWLRGEVSAALLPLRYVLRGYRPLSWGIGSAGPIRSVLLLSEYPPTQWQALVPDAASTSSIALLTWLMRRGYLRHLPITSSPDSIRVGRLFIGDAALRWRNFYPYAIDLGTIVAQKVKRPFVYAVWCARGLWRNQLEALFSRQWDFFTWSEEAAWEYRFPALKVYTYWQAIQYRLPRGGDRFWRSRLPVLSSKISYL